ncbi:hypothetical protein OG563_37450 [Nocardia vinacea]|uniref:Uncharacterized protein n=1 Tax=Nocardia vinacea TaxID=96468 RepID=A0ABZ1Z8B7_9NOCA|nr:hypothetical protein [Nocardia vinacea]
MDDFVRQAVFVGIPASIEQHFPDEDLIAQVLQEAALGVLDRTSDSTALHFCHRIGMAPTQQ